MQIHERRRLALLFWSRANKPQYSKSDYIAFLNVSDVKLNVLIKLVLINCCCVITVVDPQVIMLFWHILRILRVASNLGIAFKFRYLCKRTWGCCSLATELVLSYIFKEWHVRHYYTKSQLETSKPFCVFRWTCYDWTNPNRSLCKTYRNKIIHIHNQCVDKRFRNCSWQPSDILP